ncbi:4828_t:CDS:1, partial [Ambispora leptoticha]
GKKYKNISETINQVDASIIKQLQEIFINGSERFEPDQIIRRTIYKWLKNNNFIYKDIVEIERHEEFEMTAFT